MNLLLKSDVDNESLMLLFWSALTVDRRVVNLRRWEKQEVDKVGDLENVGER